MKGKILLIVLLTTGFLLEQNQSYSQTTYDEEEYVYSDEYDSEFDYFDDEYYDYDYEEYEPSFADDIIYNPVTGR